MTAQRPRKALTAAQEAALERLQAGEVIYAGGGVSRASATALVRAGLASWKTEPHLVPARSPRTWKTLKQHQLEWALTAPHENEER